MKKSKDALRSISEAARELGVSASALRFWESQIPQVKPVQRSGNRRYYQPDDVLLLTGIKRLLYDDGKTIKKVCEILQSQGVDHVRSLALARVGDHDGATSDPETPETTSEGIRDQTESDDVGVETDRKFPVSPGGLLQGPRRVRAVSDLSDSGVEEIRRLWSELAAIRDRVAGELDESTPRPG